jgi:drug/metabolite transporter (DMT)-like permease
MNAQYLSVIFTFFLSVICVIADYFLKRASESDAPYYTHWFIIALVVEVFITFGWIYVMQHIKLATLGALSSVFTVLLLAILGVFVFNESLSYQEITGIFLAVISLFLLGGTT